VITQPTCTVATGSVVLNGLPTTGTWTLTRNPDNITTTGNGVTTTVSNLPVGIYTYTVTNASNCTSLATASILINATSNIPNAPLVSKVIEPACDSATGSIVLEGLPATGIWRINPIGQTGTGLSTTIKGLKIGEYTYTVSNDKGCTSPPTSIVISCKKDGSISCLDQLVNVIPNGFTPGGNGVNDYFDPEKYMDIGGCSSNIKAKELYIFNRWAELIFKGNPYEKWDGRITKQQHVVPSGAYYFIFVVEVENVRKSVKGVLNVFAD
jgi:gliding motility-associated-like protein